MLKKNLSPFFTGLRVRATTAERMDDPACDTRRLRRTLSLFEGINRRFSRTAVLYEKIVFPHCRSLKKNQVTVLDAGCGGGDLGRDLVVRFRRHGLTPRILCIDADPRVIDYARQQCRYLPEIQVIHMDALAMGDIDEPVDYVVANHLLHHLPDERVPAFLRIAWATARHGVFLNDIRRSAIALGGYSLFAALFLRDGFALHDGRLSIRKSFTPRELEGHVFRAGLTGSLSVTTAPLFRVIVSGMK